MTGVDDLLGLLANTARTKLSLEGARDRKRGGNQLHLLAPLQAQPFLNAGVAILSARAPDQEIIDLFRDSSAAH
jgi:hypothetical protein